MKISLIVAASVNNVIGDSNKLPWYLPADLKHFKKITMGHHMIMGRKTYQSIGKPLPGRVSIVVTRNKDFSAPGCKVVHSIKEALKFAKNEGENEVMVIGGGEIFKQALPLANHIYLTRIFSDIKGDVKIDLPLKDFVKVSEEKHSKDQKNKYDYSFLEFERDK